METRWLHTTSENLPKLRDESKGVCVIPMGCIEKHGLHLPLGTDIIHASELAYAASQLETFTVFADYTFGSVPANYPKAPFGTIAIDDRLNWDYLEALCEQIARWGYNKIVVYNGHGGNNAFLTAFSRCLNMKKRNFAFFVNNLKLLLPHYMAEHLLEKGTGSIPELTKEDEDLILGWHNDKIEYGHGCVGETAYIMANNPQDVKMERLGIESGLHQHKTGHLKKAGMAFGFSWDIDYPNNLSGHDPVGMNQRIANAAFRMNAQLFAEQVKVLKDDETTLNWMREKQEGWNS